MQWRLWSGACIAVVSGVTVGLLAQAQPPSSAPSTTTAPAKSISVTGCVQRTEQMPTGTSGTVGATSPASDTKFLLTNAAISTSGSSTAATAGTAGTAGTVPSTAVASEYRLDAADDALLTPHVGHKVEITGTVEPTSSTASRSPSATTQPPAASAANAPKLKVESVKMVASSCP